MLNPPGSPPRCAPPPTCSNSRPCWDFWTTGETHGAEGPDRRGDGGRQRHRPRPGARVRARGDAGGARRPGRGGEGRGRGGDPRGGGGGSGIGRALALAFAREGMQVALADLDEAAMAEVAGAIRGQGSEALAVRTDVAELGSGQGLADPVGGGLGRDPHRGWQWVLGVNLWGVIHGLEAFLPRMIAQKEPAHVVNTASMAGLIASQGLGVYNTSKYAVVGLSETLAKDLRPYGIGVSVLCPMGVSTRIRTSERTRPPGLRNPTAPAAEPVELIGRSLEPEAGAGMVLDAIRANRLYVITHEEGREPLRRRFERLPQGTRASQ